MGQGSFEGPEFRLSVPFPGLGFRVQGEGFRVGGRGFGILGVLGCGG